MSTTTKASTKNCITLKGSAKLVSEFFYYGLNSILYQRGIYPQGDFTEMKQYGLKLFVTDNKEVSSYLKNILNQIKEWLERGEIQRLVLVINAVSTQEVLERWDFQIDNSQALKDALEKKKAEAAAEGKETAILDNKTEIGEKDLKRIQREVQDVIRQITACVSFLPMLEHQCAFDILVHTNKDCVIPNEWNATAPCFINNCKEVKLKSFCTSVHKVQAAVAYKLDQ